MEKNKKGSFFMKHRVVVVMRCSN